MRLILLFALLPLVFAHPRCCSHVNVGRKTGLASTPVAFPIESHAAVCGDQGKASGVVAVRPISDPTIWPTPNDTFGQAATIFRDLELELVSLGENRDSITWLQVTLNLARGNLTELAAAYLSFFQESDPKPAVTVYSVPSSGDDFSPYLVQVDASFFNRTATQVSRPCHYAFERFGDSNLVYSEAIVSGNIFQSSALVGSGSNATVQVFNALSRLNQLLYAASMKPKHVVLVHVYIRDQSDIDAVNEGYAQWLAISAITARPPARSVLTGVVNTLTPDALVFVDAVAVEDTLCAEKNRYYQDPLMVRDPLASSAVKARNAIYTSFTPGTVNNNFEDPVYAGTEGIDPLVPAVINGTFGLYPTGADGRTPREVVYPNTLLESEAYQSLQNLEYLTGRFGVSRWSWLWVSHRSLSISTFYETFNKMYGLFFNGSRIAPPARTAISGGSIFEGATFYNEAIGCYDRAQIRTITLRDWAADAQSANAFFGISRLTQTWCTNTTNPSCLDPSSFRSGSL